MGDSLTVSAERLLRAKGFQVHARVGRQFGTAPRIVRGYGRRLPRTLVLALGTNGPVSLRDCRAVLRAAGRDRRVFLVTNAVPRSWERTNNRTLRRCNRSVAPRRVRLIDWHRESAGHREWFAADGYHLSRAGRRAYARLLDRAVDRYGLR